jgi:hypothetical protein
MALASRREGGLALACLGGRRNEAGAEQRGHKGSETQAL